MINQNHRSKAFCTFSRSGESRALTIHEPRSTECLAMTTTQAKDQVEGGFLRVRSKQGCSKRCGRHQDHFLAFWIL